MLRTTVSKLRHVCALAYLVPRLLCGSNRIIPGRFERLSASVQRKDDKSTASGSQEDSDYERCQRIIDRAFSPNPPHTHYIPDPKAEPKHKRSIMNLFTPEMPSSPENQCEKCQRIINEIFGEDNAGDKKRDTVDPVCIPLTELQATTAKETEETLAQKVEVIDETPLVEAHAKSKIDGFNIHPKVLGSRKIRRNTERTPISNYSTDKHRRRKGTSRRDSTFDELAKRCLGSPSGQIDERLLKEMEKLGVPPTTRRGSRRTASDAEIVQPEIMRRRPRRPVEKTELDFMSRMRRLRELERLNDVLPPPFELIPFKANSVNLLSTCETEDDTLTVERIQPYHLTDQISYSPDDVPEQENSSQQNAERPPQQLLGHMTAAVMSDETDMMTDKSNEIEHLIIRQERLNPLKSNDNMETPIDDSPQKEPIETVITNSADTTVLKSEEMEKENNTIAREKLASTNLLSETMDPNYITSQSEPTTFIKDCKEIEILRNLLHTRLEYLTNSTVKSRTLTEFLKDSSPCANTADDHQGVEPLTIERIKPYHLKEDPNIICKETSPYTEPGILIRGGSEIDLMKENVHKNEKEPSYNNTMFRSYSPNKELLTPHQFFEQISFISRETELGSKSDLDTDYTGPERASPSRLLDTVGVVSDNDYSKQRESLPENNFQNVLISASESNKSSDKNINEYEDYDYNYTNMVEHRDCSKQAQHTHTLFSSSELSRLPLTEEETDEPVIAVEMGRIDGAAPPDKLADQNVLTYKLDTETILQSTDESRNVMSERLLSPLLDKGAVAHVATQNVGAETLDPNASSATTIPKEHPQKPLTLSEMLKKVRERNRKELCKEFVELRIQSTQIDPVIGECGKKNPPCPPPAPTCPPPPKPPCPQQKPPCPNPCKPKCPPTCPPAPCPEPKTKCPPEKKSPCDKFKKTKCSCIKIQDALTLLLYLGPQLHIPQKSMLPLITLLNINNSIQNSKAKAMNGMITNLQDLCNVVLIANSNGGEDILESILAGSGGVNYAKTYDPWAPIPSWPIPIKEEKKKIVCPKEGCKVIPPKLNAPCREINPCAHLPRHNKFTILDFLLQILGKKVVGDF